jgi:hypothetical protein
VRVRPRSHSKHRYAGALMVEIGASFLGYPTGIVGDVSAGIMRFVTGWLLVGTGTLCIVLGMTVKEEIRFRVGQCAKPKDPPDPGAAVKTNWRGWRTTIFTCYAGACSSSLAIENRGGRASRRSRCRRTVARCPRWHGQAGRRPVVRCLVCSEQIRSVTTCRSRGGSSLEATAGVPADSKAGSIAAKCIEALSRAVCLTEQRRALGPLHWRSPVTDDEGHG